MLCACATSLCRKSAIPAHGRLDQGRRRRCSDWDRRRLHGALAIRVRPAQPDRASYLPDQVFFFCRTGAIATAGCLDQAFPVDDCQPRPRIVDQVAKAQCICRDRHVGSSRRHCRGQKLVRHPQLTRASAVARFQQTASQTRFHGMQTITPRCLCGALQQLGANINGAGQENRPQLRVEVRLRL